MLNLNLDGKNIVYLILVALLIVWVIITQINNNKLQKQLNEAMRNTEYFDSLEYQNKQHLEKIKTYEIEIEKLKSECDSLYTVKNKIIIQKEKVIVSKDASEATNQLKSNLKK